MARAGLAERSQRPKKERKTGDIAGRAVEKKTTRGIRGDEEESGKGGLGLNEARQKSVRRRYKKY